MDEKLQKELAEAREALSIFAAFGRFVDASRELDGEKRLPDSQLIIFTSGGGGSIRLNMGHFRRAADVHARTAPPDTVYPDT
jgi:hypothetical protein